MYEDDLEMDEKDYQYFCANLLQTRFQGRLFSQFAQILYFAMKSNLNWFESPLPKPSNFYNLHQARPDGENQLEEHPWPKNELYSPQPLAFIRFNQTNKELSPWSKLINDPDNKEDNLVLPGLIPQQDYKHEVIEQRLVFSEDEEDDPVTPVRPEKPNDEDNEEAEMHTTGRKSEFQPISAGKKCRPRQKGLRKLSQRAYEIVQELKNATYKEVAAKLVQELNEYEFQGENKEEQNIKRRVYDALNVLIALGVLRKDGRKIVSDKGNKKGKGKEASEGKELEMLKQKLSLKSALIQQKGKKLKEAEVKLKSITVLLKRNKEHSHGKDVTIPFPFIGCLITGQFPEKKTEFTEEEFILVSRDPLQPFGDMDCLNWLSESLHSYLPTFQPKQKAVKREAQSL